MKNSWGFTKRRDHQYDSSRDFPLSPIARVDIKLSQSVALKVLGLLSAGFADSDIVRALKPYMKIGLLLQSADLCFGARAEYQQSRQQNPSGWLDYAGSCSDVTLTK